MFGSLIPYRKRERGVARREADVFDLFDELFAPMGLTALRGSMAPMAVDVRETEDAVRVVAELPGIEPGDVDLTVERGRLVISGEKKTENEEKGDNWLRRERSSGSFKRIIALPDAVRTDKADASFKNGVLTVVLPKDEKAKPRRIGIT